MSDGKNKVPGDVALEISERICREHASRFLEAPSSGRTYLSYFALASAFDKELTLRLLFVGRGNRTRGVEKVTGTDALALLSRPGVLNFLAARCRAGRVIVCLSSPCGYGIDRAYADAERMNGAVRRAELYDFVLADKGKTVSLLKRAAGKYSRLLLKNKAGCGKIHTVDDEREGAL